MPSRIHRAPVLLAAVAGALALTAGRADAAVTATVKDRVLTVTGDAAPDRLALRIPVTDPAKLQIDVDDDGTAEFTIPRAEFDTVRVRAGGGDDRVRVDDSGVRGVPTTPITIDGEAGADTLTGGRGAESLDGGDGNDVVDGNAGNDTISLGAGADRAGWDPGDGLDKVDGGAGFDRVTVSGASSADQFRVLAAAARDRLMRNGATAVYATTLERAEIAALGGDDTLDVGDTTGTPLQEVRADLAAGDDRVTVAGTPGADVVTARPNGSDAAVTGLPAFTSVAGAERMTIDGRAGDDRIDAGTLPLPVTALGQEGRDILSGTAGADTLLGGDGDDFVTAGKGDDTVRLGAGDDVLSTRLGDGKDQVDGDAGRDSISRSGTSAAEQVDVTGAAARVKIVSGADSIDGGTIEAISFLSFAGADRFVLGELAGTGITAVDMSLFDFGIADTDTVTVAGTAGGDSVRVTSGTSGVKVAGLPATFSITGASAGDRVELQGGAGEDRIDSADVAAGAILVRTDGGAGDDLLLGGPGDDVQVGGDGRDVVYTGDGDNVALGAAGDDLLIGGVGDDVLDGGLGTDRVIGGGGNDVILNRES